MVENVGLENLYIHANMTGGAYGSSNSIENIMLQACAHCWVHNVEDYMAVNESHIFLWDTYGNEISNNFLYDGYAKTSGQSYGIFMKFRNSDNLVQNNIMDKTRHAVDFEGGGSGNVIAYNFSTRQVDGENPDFLTQANDTHGAHPYMNLQEGNITPQISHDNTWGSSSHNVSYRNYISGTSQAGPSTVATREAVDIEQNNYYESFLGNVLGSNGTCSGTYELNSPAAYKTNTMWRFGYRAPDDSGSSNDTMVKSTFLRWGNYDCVSGAVKWNATELPSGSPTLTTNLPASLYLGSAPSWWGSLTWPAFGPNPANPSQVNFGQIPAQKCYSTQNLSNGGTFNPTSCYGS